MNKSKFIMILLIVVLCTVFVFADPIPIPHKYYRQDLGILCPMIKRHGKGFVTAQCREWEKKKLIYAFQKSFFEFNAHTSSHAKKIFLNFCKEKMLCSINIIWLYFQEFFNNFHRNLNFLQCSNFLYELRFKLQRVGRL